MAPVKAVADKPAVQTASLLPIAAQSGLQASPAYPSAIASDIARWNSLRQSDSLPFSSYSSFLLSHRGWPGENAMRGLIMRRVVSRGCGRSKGRPEVARPPAGRRPQADSGGSIPP